MDVRMTILRQFDSLFKKYSKDRNIILQVEEVVFEFLNNYSKII